MILIKNTTLISMDETRDIVEENIDVLIDNDIISKIDKNIKVDSNTKIIDGTNKVLMPGLINTHTHSAMSIFRETVDGLKTQDWLTKKIWPKEATLTNKQIYDYSKLSFLEMIESGTTTANDMYFKANYSIKAAKEVGIRLQTTEFPMDLNGKEDGERRINETIKLINKYKDDPLISINFGLHGFYTSSIDYINRVIELSRKYKVPLHTHFLENKQEIIDIKNVYHKEPIQVLEESLPNTHTILAHCVELSKSDIKRLSKIKANISISTNPVSNLRLGCGVANIVEMINNNINVSIGTDGQGSGTNLDLFNQMKLIPLLQKGINEDPTIINAYDVLKMATINGAKALNLDNQIGTITPNKKADLILIDISNTMSTPINNLISEIVYNINGYNVDTTIINGKIIMENRKVKTIRKKSFLDRIRRQNNGL